MIAENELDKTSSGAPVAGDGRIAGILCFLRMSLQSLRTNRFQLVLTTTTMAIGSLGLALTLFLGEGGLKALWFDLEKLLGSWVVASADGGPDQSLMKERLHTHFTEGDLEAVKNNLNNVRMVTTIYNGRQLISTSEAVMMLPLEGITPELAHENLYKPETGRGFSSHAFSGELWECMLTESAAKALNIDVGKKNTILIGGYPFTVVGQIIDPPHITRRLQARVVMPYIYPRLFWMPPGSVGQILVAWHQTQDMSTVLKDFHQALEKARGPDTFFLSSTQFAIESGKKIVYNFMAVGATQALFAILIASIGVVNVMLTNVAQRAHEYAIRVAMGASQREILVSVLIESLFLGLLGGLIGVMGAVALAPYVGERMASQIPGAARLVPVFTIKGFWQPFLVCGVSSLLAGIIPALKVRRLDILATLRDR